MAGPLIEYLCIAVEHLPRPGGEGASTVTVYAGRWAYCDSPVAAGHRWVPSGGISFELLRQRSRPTPETRSA